MNWSRFVLATGIALLISFVLAAAFSPPDPFTQIQYVVPLFVVTLPFAYRYGPGSAKHGS